ncbi:multidrug ABC transporter ATP-binding protein [Candidatus Saccharibacteria bacterium RIFCSPHIGHO2_12_FULL_49_19]|nr:MAG: multidrug ABC transporter ATP-binding protein [Candidatus Saccharibacteria bacterium RIFCSPHIGHO2_01_FULL_49_21]OGL36437.1 MAG: multidrug ABC transporter ATP-binding protein [Candidatus Saccharibacteria bacterium RIFCSPHIGHO2_12_FULL_49_19]OGL37256.1 MAG: multidrug ABC transporter ATP-binding protein [Candidatus Saccharibacteria bacterium RIFCSPLOWO2_01_FULL_49_22]
MQRSAIEAEGVTKRFGKLVAVDDISFKVDGGEIFAFLGPNGAGKSTTIKMLTTMLRPSSGKLYLAGHDVTREQAWARKSFGIVFQDPSLDEELTAYENMELHAALYHVPKIEQPERIIDLLKLVGLSERKDSFIKTFSGGMRRRLEIARGLLHHPKVLFLDEPTLGLDTQTRNVLWDYVRKLSKSEGMTIFFTTHYLDEAEEIAERIAIIDHGKIVAVGTVKELTKKTKTKTLEQAYLKLTGESIRDETSDANDGLNMRSAMRIRSLRG